MNAKSTDLEKPRRRIILGMDPGVSTGLAALDLDGKFLFAKSEREISLDRIVQEISSFGKVVLVATDVAPAPDLVRKVASMLQTAMFVPRKSMEVEEKRELVNRYGEAHITGIGDIHARDALASGIKALQKFRNKFQKLEAELPDKTSTTIKERTKELLLKGYSIDRAIESSATRRTEAKRVAGRPSHLETSLDLQKMIAEKSEVIMRLSRLVESLEEEIERLRSENTELKNRLDTERKRNDVELRKERVFKVQQRQIADMAKRLRELEEKLAYSESAKRQREKLESEVPTGMILLKPVESFSSEGLEMALERYTIGSGDVVMLKDASGGGAFTARTLAKLKPSIVVTCTAMSDQAEEVFVRHSIPIVESKLLSITYKDGNAFVPSEQLHSIVNRQRSISKSKVTSMLEEAIEGYRKNGV